MSYSSNDYEIEKVGHNKYRVSEVNGDGCATGCGCLGIPLGILGVFLLLGNAIMDDGGAWVQEFLSNPLIATPLAILFFGGLIFFLIVAASIYNNN